MSKPNLKIGDSVWIFDENRRVYSKDGGGWSNPIWREHWREHFVIGETSRSWLVGLTKDSKPTSGSVIKIQKASHYNAKIAYSQAEIDEHDWARSNRYYIAQRVEWSSPATLRKIAELIGYEEKPR
jgi:hypothetical protein